MKLPRWLLASMLSAIAFGFLSACAWWWLSWPERTAHVFVALHRDGNWMLAVQMYDDPWRHFLGGRHADDRDSSDRDYLRYWMKVIGDWQLEPNSRSLTDIVVGRQSFHIPGYYGANDAQLTAQMGKVTL